MEHGHRKGIGEEGGAVVDGGQIAGGGQVDGDVPGAASDSESAGDERRGAEEVGDGAFPLYRRRDVEGAVLDHLACLA